MIQFFLLHHTLGYSTIEKNSNYEITAYGIRVISLLILNLELIIGDLKLLTSTVYILQQQPSVHKGKSQCPRQDRRYRCSGWGASPKCRPARRPVPARLWTLQEHVGPTASTAGMAILAVLLLALAVVIPAANLSMRRPV